MEHLKNDLITLSPTTEISINKDAYKGFVKILHIANNRQLSTEVSLKPDAETRRW
jgi:hypothetical protein